MRMVRNSRLYRFPLTVVFLAVITTAGCAATPAGPTEVILPSTSAAAEVLPAPSSEPTPSATVAQGVDVAYGSLAELRAALESTGVECLTWEQYSGVIEQGTGSGWCVDSEWGLSIFDGAEDRNDVLELSAASVEPQQFLVGANWLVTRGYGDPAGLVSLSPTLGGLVWRPEDELPSS